MWIVQIVMGTTHTAMGAARIAAGAVQGASWTTRAAMRTVCHDSAVSRVMGRWTSEWP